MSVSESIRSKLSTLPHRPGVYLMKDRFGTVIYVGKARDLRKRVGQYFHPSRRLGWDLKFRALVEAIEDFDVHVVRSEPEALLLEGKLIKEFQPRYNISFRDDKRFLMVKVNFNDPIPRFTFTRLRSEDGSRYYGPFPDSGALRNTLNLLRRRFNLRGCRALTPTEVDYRHCLYGNLKWCTAPCIGNVTRGQYLDQVRAACDFLDGHCEELATQVEQDMQKAATALAYEKAAELRDLLEDLRSTTRKTTRFERTPWNLPVATTPERDNEELANALGLPVPPVRIEGFDISNISGTLKVASVVSFRHGRPDRANYRRMKIRSVEGQDDFACMAEAVRRRYSRLLKEATGARPTREEEDRAIVEELRTLVEEARRNAERGTRSEECGSRPGQNSEGRGRTPNTESRKKSDVRRPAGGGAPQPSTYNPQAEDGGSRLPDLIVVDGGKGQLNAACEELTRLGLAHLPVIGLAKEFEEIHRPGAAVPLRLRPDSNALKLLQRIRDESHRVANAYNAQLRLRKISESVLDEFPGIGETRKAALLRKFGSVQRLRTATHEQIAAVPGFGGKVAQELKAFLTARSTPPEPAEDSPPATT